MNAVLHLVRKDGERLRPPLLAWYALIVGKAWCVWQLTRATEVEIDLLSLSSVVGLLNGIEAVAGALIAMRMAFDDKPWSSTAFAATRPISRGELLGAKAAGAGLLFLVGPLVLLVPVWLAAGFSASGIGIAAADWALIQGLFVAFGLLAGVLARDSGQVLLAVPLLGGVLLAVSVYLRREPAPPLGLSVVLALAVMGAGLVLAYRVRRRVVGAVVAVLGLIVVAGMGVPGTAEKFHLPVWPDESRPMLRKETRVAAAHRWTLVGPDTDEKGRVVLIAQSARPSYPLLDTLREPAGVAIVYLVAPDGAGEDRQLIPRRVGTVRAASLSVTRWQLGLREPITDRAKEWPLFANAELRLKATPATSTP